MIVVLVCVPVLASVIMRVRVRCIVCLRLRCAASQLLALVVMRVRVQGRLRGASLPEHIVAHSSHIVDKVNAHVGVWVQGAIGADLLLSLTSAIDRAVFVIRPMTSLGLAYDSSSGEDTVEHERPPMKKRKLPTLSDSLVVLVPVDNPALHQGRTRSMPFVEGQWAAYVYVPIFIAATSPLRVLLADILTTSRASVPDLHTIPEDVECTSRKTFELHVSLSRPIYLRAHQRQDLKQAVQGIASRSPP